MLSSKLEIDPGKFLQKFRKGFVNEIAYLNRVYPLFDGNVIELNVSNTYTIPACPCGRCRPTNEIHHLESTAITNSNLALRHHIITLSGDDFGADANPDRFEEATKLDLVHYFHGSMYAPQYVLAHEYGHVIDAMIHRVMMYDATIGDMKAHRQTWSYKYPEVIEAMEQFALAAINSTDGASEVDGDIIIDLKNPNRPVSAYALTSPQEFFAETFAARCYADEATRHLPAVEAMSELLEVVYAAARKESANKDKFNGH